MKTRLNLSVILTTAWITLLCANLPAQPVTDWHTFRATTATTLSGQGTDDPVFGTTAQTSSSGVLIGYLGSPLSLVNIGDKISFRYDVSFNDATNMAATTPDQFRFALFDRNGEAFVTADNTVGAGTTDTDNFRGYWFGVKSGSGAQGSMRERSGTTADTNPFANASAALLGTAGGTSITYNGATNGVGGMLYSGEMTLELQAGGLALSGFFAGNGGSNSFSFLESTPITTTFDVVGVLSGGSLSVDQMLFQNVTVTLTPVPEPSAILLTSAGLLGLFLRAVRRRRSAVI